MDPLAEQLTNNINPEPEVVGGGMSNMPGRKISKKIIVILAAVILIIVTIVLLAMIGSAGKKTERPTEENKVIPSALPTYAAPQTSEMQKALDEAKKSASEYDDWQTDLRADYPWLRKLPLAAERYYVYYDLDKNVFVGRLYPKPGENVDSMKTFIVQQLKLKGIPTDEFRFEWLSNPKN